MGSVQLAVCSWQGAVGSGLVLTAHCPLPTAYCVAVGVGVSLGKGVSLAVTVTVGVSVIVGVAV